MVDLNLESLFKLLAGYKIKLSVVENNLKISGRLQNIEPKIKNYLIDN